MKKILSSVLVVVMVVSFGLSAFAALPDSNPVTGDSEQVTRTINLADGSTKELTVYHNTEESKNVLKIVNEERAKVGAAPLTWNGDLEEAVLIRGIELYEQDDFNHTRPDGTEWNTVSKYANGENIAMGSTTSGGAMNQWMDSSGHKTNILNTAYKSMAIASVSTKPSSESKVADVYWVQLFSTTAYTGSTEDPDDPVTPPDKPDKPTPPSSGGSSSSGSGGGYYGGGTASAVVPTSVSTTTQNSIHSKDGSVKSQKTDTLKLDDIKKLPKTGVLYADTKASNGAVVGRLYIDLKALSARGTDYKMGVETSGTRVTSVTNRFTKGFKNKLVVLEIKEKDLAVNTEVAVKVNLKDFNTKNLFFYNYDATTNKYNAIGYPQYRIDNNGFLHFYTKTGGYIVISDGRLAK